VGVSIAKKKTKRFGGFLPFLFFVGKKKQKGSGKMNSERIAVGIGIVLAVLAAFTAPAMAGPNTMYFTNYSGDTSPGGTSYVELWVNATDSYGTQEDFALGALGINITFDSSIGDITACNEPGDHPWDDDWWATKHGDSWFLTVSYKCWDHPGPPFGLGPGVYPIANYTLEGNNTGVMDLVFNFETPRMCAMCDCIGNPYPNQTWEDGTYTCTGPAETFGKELVKDWNLISLPLTADNMTVTYVFESISGNYSAIYRYDAETKHFVVLCADDVLEYGVGYFIYMTSADTWTYQGTAYSSMSIDLEQGLDMIGWLNGTKDIEDALSSIAGKYRYAARWNSTTDKFEVYVPNAPAEFNDFDTMEQGKGYFLSMKVEGETLSEGC
jgi:hypothetical protein